MIKHVVLLINRNFYRIFIYKCSVFRGMEMKEKILSYFEIEKLNTTVKREVLQDLRHLFQWPISYL